MYEINSNSSKACQKKQGTSFILRLLRSNLKPEIKHCFLVLNITKYGTLSDYKTIVFPFPTLRYITLELNTKNHSPTFDNQLERNGIRVIKINLKQHEYTFLWRFRSMPSQPWLLIMLLIWKETVTNKEIGYAKYGEYGLYSSD